MDLEITLEARDAQGKANRRLRREGLVPGIVFGKGTESTPVQVDAKTFETLYKSAGRTSVIKVTSPGAGRGKSAIIKGVQRHPVTGTPLHVDFFLVDLTHEMEVDVPLVFNGEAPAVEQTGGSVMHQLDHVRVKALPNDIPHEISVDVGVLVDLDTAIHVRDLVTDGAKATILNDPDELVAKVVPPRVEEEPEVVAEEEAEEAVEGEAPAEPTEGEVPAEATQGEGEASES